MMVDAVGHEHLHRRGAADQEYDRERPGDAGSPPAARSRPARSWRCPAAAAARCRTPASRPPPRRRTVEAAGSAPRSASRRGATNGCRIRPADRAGTGADRTSPARSAAPNLHQPHIVVGVAEPEPVDLAPAIDDEPDRDREPCDERQLEPVAIEFQPEPGWCACGVIQDCFPRVMPRLGAALDIRNGLERAGPRPCLHRDVRQFVNGRKSRRRTVSPSTDPVTLTIAACASGPTRHT